jgi:hypothetical protein
VNIEKIWKGGLPMISTNKNKVIYLRSVKARRKYEKLLRFIQPLINLFSRRRKHPYKTKYQYRKPVNH